MEGSQDFGAYNSQSSLSDLQVDISLSQSQTLSRNVVTLQQRQDHVRQAGAVISKIEAILESTVDSIAANENHISIPYRSRAHGRGSIARETGALKFPGRTPQEAKKFTSLLRILQICRGALVTGSVITKRNIYYQNTELFRDQRVVDSLVDDLAFTLGVGRDDLNIVAAAKGLIAGPIRLIMRNNSVISCLSHDNGVLVPITKMIKQLDFGETKWILVIEKEATFRTLATAGYHSTSIAGHGILLTGKGYPDLTTRSLLYSIHSVAPHLPMYALVDYDPDGISIMRTYRNGSRSLLHEENVTIPDFQWLGIRSRHIMDLYMDMNTESDSQSGQSSSSGSSQSSYTLSQHGSFGRSISSSSFSGFLQSAQSSDGSQVELTDSQQSSQTRRSPQEPLTRLSKRDRKLAVSLLKTIHCGQSELDTGDVEQVRELQVMLMLNIKAEMQTVDHLGDVTEWLDRNLCV